MRLRFLVVDDHADNARALALVLESLGHECCVAFCAESALREAARFRPHAALVDWLMPDTDGIRLATLLREHWLDLYIVLVTGYGGREPPDEAMKAGIDRHVLKPASMKDLEAIINDVRQRLSGVPRRYYRQTVEWHRRDGHPPEKVIREAHEVLVDGRRERWERVLASDRLARALRTGHQQGTTEQPLRPFEEGEMPDGLDPSPSDPSARGGRSAR